MHARADEILKYCEAAGKGDRLGRRRRAEAARRTIEAAERNAAEAQARRAQGMGATTDKGFEQQDRAALAAASQTRADARRPQSPRADSAAKIFCGESAHVGCL
jgi:hypothetical protein